VREEVRIMSKIFHPNVVLFMGACTLEGNNIMIGVYRPPPSPANLPLTSGSLALAWRLSLSLSPVSEKMPTDLETLIIRERKQISLLQRMKMAKDAALGMNWLHSSNPIFIHRDLKLSNLLVCNRRTHACAASFEARHSPLLINHFRSTTTTRSACATLVLRR